LSDLGLQIERRTYGDSNLHQSIFEWELLIKKIRVTLLLSSRVGTEKNIFTVNSIETGAVSIYRILACDTLSFVTKADLALEVIMFKKIYG
jgi:hypothetical protein